MRTRTTLLLLIIAAIIGYAIQTLDRAVPSTNDKAAHEHQPLNFDVTTVDNVTIESAESTLVLNVKDRFWRVGKPIDDLADTERIYTVLNALHDAEWLEHLKRPEMTEAAWKLTGLDKPFAHVKLSSGGHPVAECVVGNASAIEGAIYLGVPSTKPGQTDYFVARTPLAQVLKKPMEEWRDARLIRVPAESVSRITLSDGHGKIEMARPKPKAPWDLVKPLQTRGHNDRINELLAAVLALKITSVSPGESAKAISPTDALHISVHTAAAAVPLELHLNRPTTDGATTTTATASMRPHAFTVSSDRFASLWMQLNDLRDDKLARVDNEKVDGIIIKSLIGGDVTLRKVSESWQLQRGKNWEPANGDRVAKMFDGLNHHEVREFVADSAANLEPYGLVTPFLSVAWNEPGEKPATDTASLQASGKRFSAAALVGTETELQFGLGPDGKTIYAKYDGEPIIYRVGASVLSAVPRDAVRWKAPNPVRFSQFALVRIAISVGTNPPVILDHHPINGTWSGSRAGDDLSSLIDQVKADHLADKLGGLIVQDWVQDRTDGTKALKNPAVTIQATLLTEVGNLKSPTKLTTINFAPTVEGMDSALYYGRVDDGPDVFLITRTGLYELLASVLKTK